MTPTERKLALQEKLQKAVELEWATIPPYLVAYYSLKPDHNRASAAIIRSVFMEEMLHMVLAANVLTATGGSAKLSGPQCPDYPLHMEFQGIRFADRRFDIDLARFSPKSIETFLQIEMPEEFLAQPAALEMHIPGSTIGEFYRGIQSDLEELVKDKGSDFVFSGKAEQVRPSPYWGGGGTIIQIKNLATAFQALDIIIDQGEGAHGLIHADTHDFFRDPSEVPHYFRFNQIKHGRSYAATDSAQAPPTGPVFPVNFDEVYPLKPNCKLSDFSGNKTLSNLGLLFNQQYSTMIRELDETFNGRPEVLYNAILNGMHDISDTARAIVTTVLPNDPEGRHASPPFEWTPA